MDLGLQGKTAVVTGGDSGIGLATASMLLEEGVRVVIADQDRIAIEAAAARLTGDVRPCVVDVTNSGSVDAFRNAALSFLGHVDCLVHAAGITGATGTFHEIDDEGWQATLETLLMGTVRTVRASVPHMVSRSARVSPRPTRNRVYW